MKEKNKKVRVCILMNHFHVGANMLMNKIVHDPNIEIVGIFWKGVWVVSKNPKKQGLFDAWRVWGKKIGYWFLLGFIIINVLHFLPLVILDLLFLGALFKGRDYLKTTFRIASENNIPTITIKDINDPSVVEKIKSYSPDVILSNNFNQIIGKDVLAIPSLGVINVHPGILPLYRGMLPHFWTMVYGEKKGGVTLHYVDEGVDTGNIISHKEFKIKKHESFYSIWKKTAHCNAALLRKYFAQVRSGKKNRVNKKHKFSKHKGKLFRFPTNAAYEKFSARGKKLYHFSDFI